MKAVRMEALNVEVPAFPNDLHKCKRFKAVAHCVAKVWHLEIPSKDKNIQSGVENEIYNGLKLYPNLKPLRKICDFKKDGARQCHDLRARSDGLFFLEGCG